MSASAKPFQYALATNSTSTGFTAQNSTTIKPTGAGVIDLADPKYGFGGSVPDFLQIVPFGRAANNKTFDFRLYGYNPTDEATPIYVPQLLLDVSVVLSAITFSDHAASTFFADTLTVNKGAADNGDFRSLINTANDTVASLIVATRGCRFLKFDWDLAGSDEATDMNALWRGLDTITRY